MHSFTVEDGVVSFGRLKVSHVDRPGYAISVVALTDNKQEQIEILNTEDAKRVALKQAELLGWVDASIKNSGVTFGDPSVSLQNQRLTANNMESGKSFLHVEVYTKAASALTPVGDSI